MIQGPQESLCVFVTNIVQALDLKASWASPFKVSEACSSGKGTPGHNYNWLLYTIWTAIASGSP